MSRTSTSRGRSRGRLGEIDIYSPENPGGPELRLLRKYLKSHFPTVKISSREPFSRLVKRNETEKVASLLASARVKDPSRSEQVFGPMFGEIDYERRVLEGDAKAGGIVYDGRKLEEVFSQVLGTKTALQTASIMLTDRLVSTFSRDDLRHHLRTVVFGFPSIVSIPGVVEAPAKPREYYLLKQQLGSGAPGEMETERLKSAFKGRFIDYGDDEGISSVLEGLALQCVVFHLTLDPFCEKKDCRMFNAHWQEDLIRSQVSSQKLCKRHVDLVRELGRDPSIRW